MDGSMFPRYFYTAWYTFHALKRQQKVSGTSAFFTSIVPFPAEYHKSDFFTSMVPFSAECHKSDFFTSTSPFPAEGHGSGWKRLGTTGPCTAEVTAAHFSEKADEAAYWDRP